MLSIHDQGFWRWLLPLLVVPALLVPLSVSRAASATGATPDNGVANTTATSPSSAGALVVLQGSIKPVEGAPQNGPLDPHKPLITRTTLQASEAAAPLDFEVTLKLRNLSELQARVARGERILPAEMAAKYDPLPADYQAVVDWLSSLGIAVTRQDGSHMAVFARGTVSQIGTGLGVQFGRVALQGSEYTSAVSAPNVPAALAPALLGINGLQPHIQPHKHLLKQQVQPNGTNGSAPYFPSQIAQAYSASGLYTSNLTGAGQTIAIVIDTFPSTDDLVAFWNTASVNQSMDNIEFIQVVSGTLPATSGEETLDTEWSSSIAPGAKVRVYATKSLSDTYLDEAYQRIYSDATTYPGLGIHQMSMSFGEGETYTTNSQVQTDDQYFVKLAAAGVTIFASAGDGGSTPGSGSAGDETGPVQVESPASDPNVTGVGGTSLILNTNNTESSEVVWNNSSGAGGGGVSIYFSKPSWQTGTGVSGSMREVPDITASADPTYGAVVYLNGSSQAFGGTSWSSPTCAGFCALLNQARANAGQTSVGLLGPQIYPLIGSANFRDITSGNNATSNSGGEYSATTGYDEASGIGAPLALTLGQKLVASSTLLGVQTQPTVQTIVPGQNATITVAAAGTPVSYQWQLMAIGSGSWSNLSDNATYTGSATASLTVANATTALSGNQFQCNVTYTGGTVLTSPTSTLVVDSLMAISTLAGKAGTAGLVNATGAAAEFDYPSGVATDSAFNLYIADYSNNNIRRVNSAGVVTTPFGSTTGVAGSVNGTGNGARFRSPNSVAVDNSNNLYVADTGNNLIRKVVINTAVASTLAASGFNAPNGVAVDASGNVYVADTGNNVIKKITPTGTVSTLAGKSGTAGYLDGMGTAAEFNSPLSVAVDSSGNVYVADFGNQVVRKITSGGVVSTYAGQAGIGGCLDGLALQALFNGPTGVAVDTSGNVYVTDSLIPPGSSTAAGNNLVRRITTAGVVSTIAGQAGVTGTANGIGAAAQFYSPQAAAFNSLGDFYLVDTYNQTIRAGGFIPAVVTQLGSQTVTAGQSVTFSVSATGTGGLTYQWYLNGTVISGATSASFTIATVATGNAGTYSVVVTDPFGSTTSSSYTLTVNQPVPAMPAWGWAVLPASILLAVGRRLLRKEAASQP